MNEKDWELIKKIGMNVEDGGYNIEELEDMFDTCRISQIFKNFSYETIVDRARQHEEKKNKIVVGDVVNVKTMNGVKRGIVWEEKDRGYCVLFENDVAPFLIHPSDVAKAVCKIGKHFNIHKMLEG